MLLVSNFYRMRFQDKQRSLHGLEQVTWFSPRPHLDWWKGSCQTSPHTSEKPDLVSWNCVRWSFGWSRPFSVLLYLRKISQTSWSLTSGQLVGEKKTDGCRTEHLSEARVVSWVLKDHCVLKHLNRFTLFTVQLVSWPSGWRLEAEGHREH